LVVPAYLEVRPNPEVLRFVPPAGGRAFYKAIVWVVCYKLIFFIILIQALEKSNS
jgi:hypothetical protein